MTRQTSSRTKWLRPAWIVPMLGLILLVTVIGCDTGVQQLTGADRDAVLVYTEPMTDNLLAGFNAGDYATLSRDFNAQMRAAFTESQFGSTRALTLSKIGRYVSRVVSSVEKRDNYIAVIYKARFENEDNVTVRVVFEAAGGHSIAGLWFNSPKLQ